MALHHYKIELNWTGNLGTGTSSYEGYSRDHRIRANQKPWIDFSSDPAFRGNPSFYNPEEMLVAALSSCHMLWYLHLCSQFRITVIDYKDFPTGVMEENEEGSGHFKEVVLNPHVVIVEDKKLNKAIELHKRAHNMCFIANSVNFPVLCNPIIEKKLA